MGDYAYYLEFIGEDTVATVPNKFELRNTCTIDFGNYMIIPEDSIQISWTEGAIPRGPHCSRYTEYPGMVTSAVTFLRQQDTLHLNVKGFETTQNSEYGWSESMLSFSLVISNEE